MIASPRFNATEQVDTDAIQQAVLKLLQTSAFEPFRTQNFSDEVVVLERWNFEGDRLILSIYIGLPDSSYPQTGETMKTLYQSQLRAIIEAVSALPLIAFARRIQEYAFVEVLFRSATQMKELILQYQQYQ